MPQTTTANLGTIHPGQGLVDVRFVNLNPIGIPVPPVPAGIYSRVSNAPTPLSYEGQIYYGVLNMRRPVPNGNVIAAAGR